MQLFMGQLFRGKKNFKEWDKQFIREGVMQNAMYDANLVHARTVRPHKPRKSLKFLAYSSVAYACSLNTITSRSTGNVVSVPVENCISTQQLPKYHTRKAVN
jgi:hypothetical protein